MKSYFRRDFSECRSNAYQWTILEQPTAPEIIKDYSDSYSRLEGNGLPYNELLLDLEEKLKAAYWRLINENLTERQKQVIHLYSKNFTQTEIAKILGVNQSSVTKSIHGNCDYKNKKVLYGGSKKKLIKLAENDEEIKNLRKQINELIQNYL